MKRNLKMNTSWLRSSIAAAAVLMLTACSSEETDVNGSQTSDEAIRFEAGSPETYRTRAAINSDGALQTAGFGVFAYYTEATEWATAKSENPVPNFMNNQWVTYPSGQWTYTPTKYWPNDNNPADTDGATGSQTHSYLSFFAYAPYQANVSLNATTHQPEVAYSWVNDVNPASQQDLLYDNTKKDCYKTMAEGYGTTTGRVPFVFKHALSAIEFKVRRKTATGSPIFMKGLTLTPSSINTGGTFNLVEASWNTPFTTPSTMPTITYAPADILADIKSSGTGVTADTDADAHNLTNYTPNLLLMMPHVEAVTFTFTISYTIGGADKNPSSSFTIPKPTDDWALAMGKKYTVVFVIDGDEVDSYLLREAEAEQW